jgi:hypothetical protein
MADDLPPRINDLFSRVYGVANTAVLTHLLRTLITKGVLPGPGVERVLLDAQKELAAHRTEVAAAAVGIVQTIRERMET